MKSLILFPASCALLPAAWFVVALDTWAGVSRSLVFEASFVSLGILVGALVLLVGGRKALLLVPSAFILFMIALPFTDLSPVKPAVRAVDEIRPGMTEPQVRAVLERSFPAHGRIRRPAFGTVQDDVLGFVLDPSDGRYNAAVVQIRFSAGKCVSAEFLPD